MTDQPDLTGTPDEQAVRAALHAAADTVTTAAPDPAVFRAAVEHHDGELIPLTDIPDTDRPRGVAVRWHRWVPAAAAAVLVAGIAGIAAVLAAGGHGGTPAPAASAPTATAPKAPTAHSKPPITAPVTPSATQSLPSTQPVCAPAALTATFIPTGREGGGEYAAITVTTTSSTPCTVSGSVTIEPLDAAGRPITTAPGWVNHAAVPRTTLTATGGVRVIVGGQYRDDPTAANGLCATTSEVTPDRWRVQLGRATLTVTNSNPTMPGRQVSGCKGDFLNIEVLTG